jgi:hypothetical protein
MVGMTLDHDLDDDLPEPQMVCIFFSHFTGNPESLPLTRNSLDPFFHPAEHQASKNTQCKAQSAEEKGSDASSRFGDSD